MNIYQRINNVMKEVAYVKKDAQISGGGQNYSAVTHDQVVSMVRTAMVNNGIICFPEQVKGEMLITRDLSKDIKMHLYQGEYRIHFVGIDEGDSIVCVVQSHANDNGDKAPGKALTYAVKSAMLKVFNLETGINDESREDIRDNESGLKPISAAQLVELLALMKETNTEESSFIKFLKVDSLQSTYSGNFEAAKNALLIKKSKIKEENNANS